MVLVCNFMCSNSHFASQIAQQTFKTEQTVVHRCSLLSNELMLERIHFADQVSKLRNILPS